MDALIFSYLIYLYFVGLRNSDVRKASEFRSASHYGNHVLTPPETCVALPDSQTVLLQKLFISRPVG